MLTVFWQTEGKIVQFVAQVMRDLGVVCSVEDLFEVRSAVRNLGRDFPPAQMGRIGFRLQKEVMAKSPNLPTITVGDTVGSSPEFRKAAALCLLCSRVERAVDSVFREDFRDDGPPPEDGVEASAEEALSEAVQFWGEYKVA